MGHDEPEIIVRFDTNLCSDPDKAGDDLCIAEFSLIILANREGFQFLADQFAQLAQLEDLPEPSKHDPDPDDHSHLWGHPLNSELSEPMECRIGRLSKDNRRAVLKHYGIQPMSDADRAMPARLLKLAGEMENRLRIAREELRAMQDDEEGDGHHY